MKAIRVTIFWFGFLAGASPAGGAGPEPFSGEVDRLVRDLGSDSFETREAAFERLREHGRKDKEAVLAALPIDGDPEVLARAEQLRYALRFTLDQSTLDRVRGSALAASRGDADLERNVEILFGELPGAITESLQIAAGPPRALDEASPFMGLIEQYLGEHLAAKKKKAATVLVSLMALRTAGAQMAVIRSLENYGHPSAARALVEFFPQLEGHARSEAIRMLGGARGEGVSAVLVPCLKDPDPNVRASTLLSLGMIGDPASVERIGPLLADPHPLVRRTAAQALWLFPGLMPGRPPKGDDLEAAAKAWWEKAKKDRPWKRLR